VVRDPSDGLFYVCESTTADTTGPALWPQDGIQRHEWSEWVALAQNGSFQVAVLPAAPAYAAGFNHTAFWDWFYSVEGQAYGYHNFLFSFSDAPATNLPAPLTAPLAAALLNFVDGLLPNSSTGVSGYSCATWALNKRLNASCDSVACIIDLVNANAARGNGSAGGGPTSLGAAFAIPEDDGWRYGGNTSLVCSAFAAMGLNVGLGALLPPITATEQTPRDNFMLGIWDGDYYSAANCPAGLISPVGGNGSACQIMGAFVMPLNGFNTIQPYARMNEACVTRWPDYERCPGGGEACQC
jgi:hypothetical protein